MDSQAESRHENGSISDKERISNLLKNYLEGEQRKKGKEIVDEDLARILACNPFRKAFFFILAFVLIIISLFGCYSIGRIAYYNVSPVSECLVENVIRWLPFERDILRSGADCRVCQNVRKIARRQKLSPAEFERKYAYTKRPVVVTDAAKNWTAINEFSFQFLKGVFRGQSLEAVAERCQFFPYRSNFDSLGDVFNMPPSRAHRAPGTEPWYVGWSNCHIKAAETLRKHYGRPYFLPALSEASKVDWIFMGSPGYGAPLHIDHVKLPSWQAQLKGRKLWTLEPPYECRLQCPTNLSVVVNPGDIIVIDTNFWYHATEIIGKEMSITIGTEYD